LTGPIRGQRQPAEVKRLIVGVVTEAKTKGMPFARACEILMIDARRVRRWIAGRDPSSLSEDDLRDTPPVARVAPHKLTEGERNEIVKAARDEKLAHLRHRKLTHTLSRQDRVFCGSSTTLRGAAGRGPGAGLPPSLPAEQAASCGRRVRAQPHVAL
jgi:hypothetical protein